MGFWTYQGNLARGPFLLAVVMHAAANTLVEEWILPQLGFGGTMESKVMGIILCGVVTLMSLHFFIVRRLHDAGKSGWLAWGLLVPILNLYVFYNLLFVGRKEASYALA